MTRNTVTTFDESDNDRASANSLAILWQKSAMILGDKSFLEITADAPQIRTGALTSLILRYSC
jgi:hypothetical protein